MGKKVIVTIYDKAQSLSDWARDLGISRQRASQLHAQGRLLEYINGERKTYGRPPKKSFEEKIAELDDLSIWDAAKKLGVAPGVVFDYRNKSCGK